MHNEKIRTAYENLKCAIKLYVMECENGNLSDRFIRHAIQETTDDAYIELATGRKSEDLFNEQ